MTRSQIAVELERSIDQLDREARDNGHVPHPWSRDETFTSHTACVGCGRTMVVRVYDGHTFKSGLSAECKATKQ